MELAAVEEKEEVSVFERILFALFPFLIIAVLILLLLTLLSSDFRAKALDVARDIPVIKALVPESTAILTDDGELKAEKLTTKLLELEEQVTQLSTELSEAEQQNSEQAAIIQTLTTENDGLKTEVSAVKTTGEEYTANIVELSNMFSKMTASKAAPIIQALTLDEMALIFSHMKTANQVAIMEKMNPTVAADVTMKLKDLNATANLEIAALQARITELESKQQANSGSTTISDQELANSLAGMSSDAAAELLKNMMKISSSKVLRVLSVMNNDSRSGILESYAELDADEAALIASRLLQ